VIAGIVIKNKRQKQLQNMRNSIADDLHDGIGSALSSISIMNELAKEKSRKPRRTSHTTVGADNQEIF
jgi:signal transduction histidine kinase